MEKKDYYEILNVDKSATNSEIKKQFKNLAKKYHPDKQTDVDKIKENEEKFKEINEAYSIITDKEKRKLYDLHGHDLGKSRQAEQSDDIHDFIRRTQEQFFGQQGPPQTIFNIGLTLFEIYTGINKKIKYKVDRLCSHCGGHKYNASDGGSKGICSDCNGSGMVMTRQGNMMFGQQCQRCGGTGNIIINGCKKCNETGFEKIEQTIEITIPKGIHNGSHMTIQEKGNEVFVNGKSMIGDLIVVINELDNTDFIREGYNLHRILNVSIIDSMLGEEAEVETINGKKIKFKLKVGTDSDEKFRMVGLGMPIINTENFGDFYVHIKHIMLKELNNKQIELLKELKKHTEDGK